MGDRLLSQGSELARGGQSRTFIRRFSVPPEAIWPILSDTARFNEAAKLPKHSIEEIPQDDGSVQYVGRAKIGPFSLVWDDKPVNWVTNRWFRHCREMRNGPLRYLCVQLTLVREGNGCRADYTVEAAPANILGRLMLATRFFSSTQDMFMDLANEAEQHATGASPMPFHYQAPPIEVDARAVDRLVERIEASKRGHGLARRLADYVLQSQEVDLVRVRPLRLARDWDAPPQKLIELCLESVRAGLLSLRWDLLCPRCRVGKAAVEALDELPEGAHCDTCNISYDRDFSRNVEVAFAPAPQVRPIEAGEYCLFGPMSTPHIWIQLTLASGAREVVDIDLPPGPYRARTLAPGPEFDFEIDVTGAPGILVDAGSIRAESSSQAGAIVLENRSGRTKTVIVEELHWVRDALTADRVTTMQAFRDLFSDQVLRPGDEVSVGRVTLMFTDLRGSTALYSDVGDAAAYHLVREHFAFLARIVRAHGGAVVKTIGDAIMAAFSDPADALRAALEAQREVGEFNRTEGGQDLVIKLGLHEGPCIAVTLNGRLDYFGTSVNMAARLQAQSRGADIVLSKEIFANPALSALLDGVAVSEESVHLKGFSEPVGFCRLTI